MLGMLRPTLPIKSYAGGGLFQPRPYKANNSGAFFSYHRITEIRSGYKSEDTFSRKDLFALIKEQKI